MKKTLSILLAVLMLSCLCIPAFADPISSYDLFTQWENGTYPDYVTGVFYNTETQNLSIILKENTTQRQAEVNEMLSDAAAVTYFTGEYSHDELEAARAAIADEMAAQDGSELVGVGVGWSVISGGFGESGKDFRVVVSVMDDKAGEYGEKYAAEYGDMVVVEASSAVATAKDNALQNSTADGEPEAEAAPNQGLSNWGIIGIVAICLAGLMFGISRFVKNRHKKDNNIQL